MSEIPTLRFSRKPFPSSRFHSKTSGFLFFFKTSQICYTYYLKLSKNSTSNASLLKQLKKSERTVKIQDRLRSLRTLQTTKRDRNVVEIRPVEPKSHKLWDKKLQTPPPWEPKAQELAQPPVFLSLKVGMSDVNVTFASQGARKALYFMYSFLFQKYTGACIALEEYNSNLKCCCFYASSPPSCLRHHVCYPVLKAAKHSFKPSLFSGTLLVASNACEKHRGFVRLFFNYRKQSMSATKLR